MNRRKEPNRENAMHKTPMTVFISVLIVVIQRVAWAEQILDPRQPEAVAIYLRGQGFQCPSATELRLEGQTNRGNLYRIGCGSVIGATSRWYQMILSPDESHVSLYPCTAADQCPIRLR